MTAAGRRIAQIGRWQHRGLAALGGGLAAVGLAPFDLPWLALAGFALLVLLLQPAETARQGAATAWIGGTAYFALALHWIVEPFFVDPWRHGWLAPFALVFMAGGLAVFWAAAGAVAVRVARPGWGRALTWALALSLAEVLRAYVLTGFPWAHPGHIWIGSPLLPLAAWLGPHGLTVMTVLVAALLSIAVWSRPWAAVVPIGLLALGLGLASRMPPPPPAGDNAPVVRLVQPNAQQHLKWLPEMMPVFFRRSLQLTAQEGAETGPPPDLVIWPETTLPVPVRQSDGVRAAIAEAGNGAEIILGAQRLAGGFVRNALLHLDPAGEIASIYDKHHLVPFGEYIPLVGMARAMGLRGLAEAAGPGYAPGPGAGRLDLGPLGTVFPMICYETIFPHYIGQVPRPDWMVQITNDAWFGEFSGPYQHLELAQLRAAEQGLPLLRAANTGVSAVIDARGRILASLPLGEHGALDAPLPVPLPPTLYSRMGDGPAAFLLVLGLGGLIVHQRRLRH